jgi:mRNA interferase RelE/StbE|tara:strand:+ start:332 stop:580 length:249 start_codon:yes stop_codon:yes gene_type:complete
MYDFILTDKAKKQLNKFPSNLRNRIGIVFERIKIRPYHFVKRKQGTPYYILRIGEHRAILDIKNNKLIILVLEIGYRKNIYK